MVSLTRGRRPDVPAEPGRPHEFVELYDPGMASLASGAGGGRSVLGGISPVTIADNYMRKSRCGLPGCGRDRFDPLHTVEEA
jgi:hypothetical protein